MLIIKRILLIALLGSLFSLKSSAQNFGNALRPVGRSNANGQTPDSLQKRDQNADSITIFYKWYNNNDIRKLDSSINDFFIHFPLPYTTYNLGNLGTASKSYLLTTQQKGGFDAGFHAYDGYFYTLAATPFYQTTRPFTELGYLIGAKGEQLIEIKHTQNKTQQLNFSFDYRFSNAPGNLKNQNANLNNMRITAHFQSKRKRYESYWVMLNNKAASSENGGLIKPSLLDSLSLNNPYELETRLGVSGAAFRNPFNTSIATGSTYKNNTYLWRQTYDFGQKDSIVKDTVVIHLFYPRLRLQNEIKIESNQFLFEDKAPNATSYLQYFNYVLPTSSSIKFLDNWNKFSNDFSLISYPQKNNANQFLQIGSGYSQFTGTSTNVSLGSGYDLYGFGAYKNKTKNQLWDLMASGKLYINGYHAGDYDAQFYLSRILNTKGTYLKISFLNSNRTPSTNYLGWTQFPINALKGIQKENIVDMGGELGNLLNNFRFTFNYQLINNYNYFSSGFQPAVYTKPISYINSLLANKIKISKYWNWYNETTFQIVDAAAPIHIPFIISRQRVAFEGNFYKNLHLSTGLEFIFHSDFKVDNYMPLTGQFYFQNSYMLHNRPTTNAFLHFMIKRFKSYIRLENLNTLIPTNTSLGNTYNFAAQNYPGTGTWLRVGIWWNFIN